MARPKRSRKPGQRKPATAPTPSGQYTELKRAQKFMERAQEKFEQAQADRLRAILALRRQGVSVQEIATALSISRSKVYQLISSSAGRQAPQT